MFWLGADGAARIVPVFLPAEVAVHCRSCPCTGLFEAVTRTARASTK
jgi:hypothetical protein